MIYEDVGQLVIIKWRKDVNNRMEPRLRQFKSYGDHHVSSDVFVYVLNDDVGSIHPSNSRRRLESLQVIIYGIHTQIQLRLHNDDTSIYEKGSHAQ